MILRCAKGHRIDTQTVGCENRRPNEVCNLLLKGRDNAGGIRRCNSLLITDVQYPDSESKIVKHVGKDEFEVRSALSFSTLGAGAVEYIAWFFLRYDDKCMHVHTESGRISFVRWKQWAATAKMLDDPMMIKEVKKLQRRKTVRTA